MSQQGLSPVLTRRKWRLYAHDQHIVIVNGSNERFVHPLMKAFIWALYLPTYPDITVEVEIGDRYKPDVVAFAPHDVRFRDNEPIFWGEAGHVAPDKVAALVRRYPDTHFALAKWQTPLRAFSSMVEESLDGVKRNAPFDVLSFDERHIGAVDDDGRIHLTFDQITWQRFEA